MKKRILLVDDIELICKMFSKIFTQANYHIVGQAADGQAAVECFEKFKPDLVCMDIVLPKMSGIEATRQILQLEKRAKVIIVSGLDQAELMVEAICAGAVDYLTKPCTPQELLNAAERALLGDDYLLGKSIIK